MIKQSLLLLALALYIIALLFLPEGGLMSDISCWIRWTTWIKRNGFPKLFESDCNYMPLYTYVLLVYCHINTTIYDIIINIHYLKLFTLIFDFLGAYMVAALFPRKQKQMLVFVLILLNPAYIYNSLLWGQVDAIYTAFILLSTLSLYKKQTTAGTLYFALAVITKVQAIIFLPVLLLLYLSPGKTSRAFVKDFFIFSSVIAVSFIPFIYGSGLIYTFDHVCQMILNHSNVISNSAYNIWELLDKRILYKINDNELFHGLSFKIWGNFLFIVLSAITTVPLIISLYSKRKKLPPNIDLVFLTMATTTLIFFYFRTGMHERYVHPAILLYAGYSFLTRKYFPFLLISIGYFLHLENICMFFNINHDSFLFTHEFISILFLLTLFNSFYELYLYFRIMMQQK